MFVCVDRHEPRKTTYTDATGKFQVALPAGRWRVYDVDADGKPSFHRIIDVRENKTSPVYIVSR
jgi:hypothetical protein